MFWPLQKPGAQAGRGSVRGDRWRGLGMGGVLSSRGFLEGRLLMISIVTGVACGVIHYVSGHWPSGFLAAVAVSESAFLA